jgi:hypothetical protein
MKNVRLKLLILLAFVLGSFAVSGAVPAVPARLQYAWVDYDILLRWDAVPDAASYNVYRYDTAAATWTLLASDIPVPRYRDPFILDVYEYTVTAVNGDGESAAAQPVIAEYGSDPVFLWEGAINWTMYDVGVQASIYLNAGAPGDVMIELGPSWSELTHFVWITNFASFHTIMVTNLQPNTYYDCRVTSVSAGRVGSSILTSFVTRETNLPPVAQPVTDVIWEDIGPVNIQLVGEDPDHWIPLLPEVLEGPSHGTLIPILFYSFTYIPDPNFFGTDSFTFRVTDGLLWSEPATYEFIVTPVNDAPVADDQSLTTDEDASASVVLTGSDVEMSALSFVVLAEPTNGVLSGIAPNLTYTPNSNFNGSDSFTFKVNDGTSDSAAATVSIIVTAVNDAPVANNQSVTTDEDAGASIVLTGSDIDMSALSFALLTVPANGTLSGTAPNLTYTPNSNFNGSDSFTFKVNDGTSDSAAATVSIIVTAVNDTPTANNQSLTTDEDASASIVLTGSDVEMSALSFAVLAGPANGTLSGTAPNLTYTPNANFNGSDAFTFKVNDGAANSPVATVTLAVSAVNDAPVATAQSVNTSYSAPVDITLAGSDAEGSALSFTVVSNPAEGTLTGSGAAHTFTPNTGWSGVTSFTFKANDGALDSAVATVTVTVAGAGTVPAAPSGLSATAVSTSQINLTWNDNSTNEDGFKIERSSNNSTWTQIGTVGRNATTFSSTGLSANKTYYHRVRAYNVLGNSAYSNTASAKTLK